MAFYFLIEKEYSLNVWYKCFNSLLQYSEGTSGSGMWLFFLTNKLFQWVTSFSNEKTEVCFKNCRYFKFKNFPIFSKSKTASTRLWKKVLCSHSIFIDILMWCLHNVFVRDYFWNCAMRNLPYRLFKISCEHSNLKIVFLLFTIASHSWKFRKGKK